MNPTALSKTAIDAARNTDVTQPAYLEDRNKLNGKMWCYRCGGNDRIGKFCTRGAEHGVGISPPPPRGFLPKSTASITHNASGVVILPHQW